MDAQMVINALIAIVCGGMGWWMRSMYNTQVTLQREVKELAVAMPTNYVMKTDLQRMESVLIDRLDRLEEKLDRNQAKQ